VGSIVLDASVVIAVLDPRDAHHDEALRLLDDRAGDRWAMSTVTLAEVLVHPMRLGREAEAEDRVERLGIRFVDADRAVAKGAARLRAEHPGLRTPDAFVLATAQETAAEPVTSDERLGGVIQRL